MEINVDSILQGLKDGKSTRTQQSLETLNGILQHYVESGQRDFSVVQIGRISAAKDGPGYEAIRATRNQHYRDLINAWAQKCNTSMKKPLAPYSRSREVFRNSLAHNRAGALGFHKENILLTAEPRDNRKQEHDYAHTAQPMEKASPHKHSVAQCLNIGKYS